MHQRHRGIKANAEHIDVNRLAQIVHNAHNESLCAIEPWGRNPLLDATAQQFTLSINMGALKGRYSALHDTLKECFQHQGIIVHPMTLHDFNRQPSLDNGARRLLVCSFAKPLDEHERSAAIKVLTEIQGYIKGKRTGQSR